MSVDWTGTGDPLRTASRSLAVRDVPRTHDPFEHLDDEEQNGAQDTQQDDCGKHPGRLETALRGQDDVAEAGLRGDELTGDRADEGQRYRHFHAGKKVRQR